MDDAVAQSQMSQLIQKLPAKDKEDLQRFIKGETQKSQIQQSEVLGLMEAAETDLRV